MIPIETLSEVGMLLQVGGANVPEVGPGVSPGSGAFGAFLSTLLIGAIMIALVPGYTERLVNRIDDDIVGSFIYGLVALVALIILGILLVVTIVGIIVAIPVAFLAGLGSFAVGATGFGYYCGTGKSERASTNGYQCRR